jgi:hypothetical protein
VPFSATSEVLACPKPAAEKRTAGAEARLELEGLSGATEVVPFPSVSPVSVVDAGVRGSHFSQNRREVGHPFLCRFRRPLKSCPPETGSEAEAGIEKRSIYRSGEPLRHSKSSPRAGFSAASKLSGSSRLGDHGPAFFLPRRFRTHDSISAFFLGPIERGVGSGQRFLWKSD